MLRKLKKAQAAMDFLMSYGWAILIVLVAVVSLFYFGALGKAAFIPEKCIIGKATGLSCEDFTAYQGTIILRLKNTLSQEIEITEASISQSGNSCNLTTSVTMPAGSSANLELTKGPTCLDLTTPGTKLNGDISITFKKTNLGMITRGNIQSKIQEVSAPECGNNLIETGEECDNGDDNGVACTPYYEGNCTYCSESCTNIILQGAYCGDNNKDDEEICDGTALNGEDCQTQGFESGTLSCLSDCSGYNTTSCVEAPSFPQDYISWWRFEENTNDETSTNNGIFVGGTEDYTAAISGMAIALDGTNDYIDCGNSDSLKLTNQFTISYWAKSNIDLKKEGKAWYGGVEKSGEYRLGWQGWTDGITVDFYDNSGKRYFMDTNNQYLLKDQWYHIVGLYDGTNLKVYINGVFVRSQNKGSYTIRTTTGNNFRIGGGSSVGYFNGALDEVVIYNRALTEAELQKIYCKLGGTASFCSS